MTLLEAPFVYLASQSPRRRELLAQIGVACRLLLPDADTDKAAFDALEALEAELAGESPEAYVQRVTLAKLDAATARWAGAGLPPAPILCADTTVALGRRVYGKPADAEDAAQMLRQLSGRTHRVLTAVAVEWPAGSPGRTDNELRRAAREGRMPGEGRALPALSRSRVRVAPLEEADIAAYLATGEPFGKAGAYAIQGAFAAWVEHIDGSPSGIMGLPLYETAQLLRRSGVRFP